MDACIAACRLRQRAAAGRSSNLYTMRKVGAAAPCLRIRQADAGGHGRREGLALVRDWLRGRKCEEELEPVIARCRYSVVSCIHGAEPNNST